METNQSRRYLTDFDSTRVGHVLTDVLVVGGGVAGLSAALEASNQADVILIKKGATDDACTYWAQGGVAAVFSDVDSVERHVRDTLTVGAGLNRPATVELTCRQGPQLIHELIAAGMNFDRTDERVDLGLEGGHSHPRVLHSGGDATGKGLLSFLLATVTNRPSVRVFEKCFLIDLLTVDGSCVGAVTYHPKHGHQLIWATRTIIASGGFGRVFRETTNPPGITGDGIAAAFRAGATACDMEMIQFHPTTLYVAGATRALISEAVRGEGGHLVDQDGRRFMSEYHAAGELAPRDVVSRAIVDHLRKTERASVFLDVRHLGREFFAARFPNITATCQDFGIDVGTDLIPVRPAAHFTIGGILTDLETRTSLPGLLCCGESACSGLHGANRLASNSLLEGLVLGKIAGRVAGEESRRGGDGPQPYRVKNACLESPKTMLDLADVHQSLRSLMWRNAGVVRHGDRLKETIEIIDFWSKFVLDKTFDEPAGWEIQNMLLLSKLVAVSALARTASLGVHYRSDFPNNSVEAKWHTAYTLQDAQLTRTRLDLNFQPVG